MSLSLHKTACVVIIGNEILTGRTQDINLIYIAEKFMQAGIRLAHARVIADIEDDIVKNIREVSAAYDYVLTTGGIGPTHDDITAQSVAKAFNVPHVLNEEARARLLKHYADPAMLTPPRLRMATLPEGASLIDNPVSAAPGFRIKNVFVMAGVPKIMQAMLDSVIPQLQGGPPILSKSMGVSLPESKIAAQLGELAARYPDLDIGSYPYFKPTGYGLSLVIRGSDKPLLEKAFAELFALITHLGGQPVALD